MTPELPEHIERNAEIRRLRREGVFARAIAEQFGISEARVRFIASPSKRGLRSYRPTQLDEVDVERCICGLEADPNDRGHRCRLCRLELETDCDEFEKWRGILRSRRVDESGTFPFLTWLDVFMNWNHDGDANAVA